MSFWAGLAVFGFQKAFAIMINAKKEIFSDLYEKSIKEPFEDYLEEQAKSAGTLVDFNEYQPDMLPFKGAIIFYIIAPILALLFSRPFFGTLILITISAITLGLLFYIDTIKRKLK